MQHEGPRGSAADVGALTLFAVLALAAWWVVALPPFSGLATTAVVLVGVAAMAVGTRERRRAPPPDAPTTRGLAKWAALTALAGAWQLAAYLQHPRDDHPTISSLTNGLLDSHGTRAAGFVVWLAVARGLARR